MNNRIKVSIQIENNKGEIQKIQVLKVNKPELFSDMADERRLFVAIYGDTE